MSQQFTITLDKEQADLIAVALVTLRDWIHEQPVHHKTRGVDVDGMREVYWRVANQLGRANDLQERLVETAATNGLTLEWIPEMPVI